MHFLTLLIAGQALPCNLRFPHTMLWFLVSQWWFSISELPDHAATTQKRLSLSLAIWSATRYARTNTDAFRNIEAKSHYSHSSGLLIGALWLCPQCENNTKASVSGQSVFEMHVPDALETRQSYTSLEVNITRHRGAMQEKRLKTLIMQT